jgi:hypothetical protein
MTSTSSRWTSFAAITAVVAAALMPQAAHAALRHRYTFSGDANDSVGSANGVVVDGGAQTHQYLNGMLVLTGNNGEGSNGIAEDAYVNLPNGIVSAAAASGTSGAISFEWWATVGTQRTWQRFGDFGTSNDGEDTSNSGNASSYLTVTPNSGGFNNGLAMHASFNGAENTVGLPGPFPIGAQKHVVAVYDKTNTGGGARPGGTQSLYLDGVNVATGAINAGLDLNTLNDNNNWLGRSQWGDPVFDGVYNEFSIYDHPLSQGEVTANFAAGPVGGTILPAATVNRDTGAISLSSPNGTLQLTGYTVRSNAGTLIPENWFEISGNRDVIGNGSFDVDDLWQAGLIVPTTPQALEETMQLGTGGADNGGPLGATPLSITDAGQRLWRKFYNEDVSVVMQVRLPGGALVDLPAAVTFTGGAGVPWRRSDLNFDGSINPADYNIYRSNMLKPITTTAGNDPESYPFGDLDGDQDNDYGDFRIFKRDYDAANGEGALAALAGAVPEPSGAALAALAVAGGLVRRRRGA